jgi:putative ABC transport system permease protein
LARGVLARFASDRLGDDMLSELDHEYTAHIRVERGVVRAHLWYWRQVIVSLPPLLFRLPPSPNQSHLTKGDGVIRETARDIRYAWRSMRAHPVFSVVAVLTMALGIGTTTAMFSVVNGVVLRPLPYGAPDRLVEIWRDQTLSKATLELIRSETTTFTGLAGFYPERSVLTGVDEPLETVGAAVSANYFHVLGVSPFLGRFFNPDQNETGYDDAVVLSHGLWSNTFGQDPDVIGQTVHLADKSRTIVGVAAADHREMRPGTQFWIPFAFDRSDFSDYQGVSRLHLIGRLVEDATPTSASAELGRVAVQIQQETPTSFSDEWVRRATAVPLGDAVSADVASTLWTLLGAVAFVLLIACANVANLLLARSGARETEIAVRMGIGASRWRLVRQLMTESAVLGFVGGAAGLFFAALAIRAVGAGLPPAVLRADTILLDRTVFLFAGGASLFASLIFGIVPAIRATAGNIVGSLREGGRTSTAGAQRHRINMALVAMQTAASVVLVIGAGLMLRSFKELRSADLGFNTEQVITMRVRLPGAARYEEDLQRATFYGELDRAVRAIPGVGAVGAASALPMASGPSSSVWSRPDRPQAPDQARPFANFQLITPGYFDALGVPLLAGRLFNEGDRPDDIQVGMINQSLARVAFGDEDPLGKQIEFFGGGALLTIVGVVGDAHQLRPELAPEPEVYMPYQQVSFYSGLFLVARVTGNPLSFVESFRQTIRGLDPDVAVSGARTMEDIVGGATADSQFFTLLIAAFGGLALILGAIGIYGVLSYVVSERIPEFGIRLALGGESKDVVFEAMRRAALPVGVGIAVGLVGAFATTRLLANLLFGVSPTDPVTFVIVPLVFVLVAAIASYLPARRASRVDLVGALGR